MTSEIGTCLFVELRLRVTDDQRFLSRRTLENTVHAKCPCLFGAAGSVHSQIAVQAGISRNTYGFAVQHSENYTPVVLHIGYNIQDTSHFLTAHPTRCSVGAFGRISEIPILVVFACVAVAHAHNHDQKKNQQQHAYADSNQSIWEMESCSKAVAESGRWHLGSCAISGVASGILPYGKVGQKLTNVAAGIKNCHDCHRSCKQAFQDFTLVYGKISLQILQSR